jgi:hypothetical protein
MKKSEKKEKLQNEENFIYFLGEILQLGKKNQKMKNSKLK